MGFGGRIGLDGHSSWWWKLALFSMSVKIPYWRCWICRTRVLDQSPLQERQSRIDKLVRCALGSIDENMSNITYSRLSIEREKEKSCRGKIRYEVWTRSMSWERREVLRDDKRRSGIGEFHRGLKTQHYKRYCDKLDRFDTVREYCTYIYQIRSRMIISKASV